MLKWKLAHNHILDIQRMYDALYITAFFGENIGNNAQNCSEFCLLSKRTILKLENSKLYVSLTTFSCPWFHFCYFLLTWIVMGMGCCSNSLSVRKCIFIECIFRELTLLGNALCEIFLTVSLISAFFFHIHLGVWILFNRLWVTDLILLY